MTILGRMTTVPVSSYTVEPSSVTEARLVFNRRVDRLVHKFVNESVQATTVGKAAIEAGDFVTLGELRQLIKEE